MFIGRKYEKTEIIFGMLDLVRRAGRLLAVACGL
jgi:hypothetical protein